MDIWKRAVIAFDVFQGDIWPADDIPGLADDVAFLRRRYAELKRRLDIREAAWEARADLLRERAAEIGEQFAT